MFIWFGNKRKVVKTIIQDSNILEFIDENTTVIEPLAGSMTFSRELPINTKVIGNDSHYGLYCFWLNVQKQPEALCKEISQYNLNNLNKDTLKKKYYDLMTENIAVINKLFRKKGRTNREELEKFSITSLQAAALFLVLRRIETNYTFPWESCIEEETFAEIRSFSQRMEGFTCYDFAYFLKMYKDRLNKSVLVYLDPPSHPMFKHHVVHEWVKNLSDMEVKFIYITPYSTNVEEQYSEYCRNVISTREEKWELLISNFPLQVKDS